MVPDSIYTTTMTKTYGLNQHCTIKIGGKLLFSSDHGRHVFTKNEMIFQNSKTRYVFKKSTDIIFMIARMKNSFT